MMMMFSRFRRGPTIRCHVRPVLEYLSMVLVTSHTQLTQQARPPSVSFLPRCSFRFHARPRQEEEKDPTVPTTNQQLRFLQQRKKD